ncbi:kinase-like domain-containing protein [Gautieria morchelliformis]|nr:kinase-like domain-containing protein [Gautieria morchelliformis]
MAAPPLPSHLNAVLTGRRNSRRAYELREPLWEHFQPFLAGRGYRLSLDGDNLISPNMRVASDPFSPRVNEAFSAATAGRVGVKWGGPRVHPFLMGAYDRQQRFVVLKIVSSSGGELSIIQRLASPAARRDATNHTIPVLEYIRAGDWCFIVMPSWELTLLNCIPIATVADLSTIAAQCFQGLAYMHKQRIAHLDIYPPNILANHVTHRPRGPFLRSFDFRLAYIDFEFSVCVSREVPLVDVRCLPPTYHDLPEVRAKKSHVDPFAADVFALGRALKEHVRAHTGLEGDPREIRHRASRYLALLERMTGSDPTGRPSIEQALHELRVITSHN